MSFEQGFLDKLSTEKKTKLDIMAEEAELAKNEHEQWAREEERKKTEEEAMKAQKDKEYWDNIHKVRQQSSSNEGLQIGSGSTMEQEKSAYSTGRPFGTSGYYRHQSTGNTALYNEQAERLLKSGRPEDIEQGKKLLTEGMKYRGIDPKAGKTGFPGADRLLGGIKKKSSLELFEQEKTAAFEQGFFDKLAEDIKPEYSGDPRGSKQYNKRFAAGVSPDLVPGLKNKRAKGMAAFLAGISGVAGAGIESPVDKMLLDKYYGTQPTVHGSPEVEAIRENAPQRLKEQYSPQMRNWMETAKSYIPGMREHIGKEHSIEDMGSLLPSERAEQLRDTIHKGQTGRNLMSAIKNPGDVANSAIAGATSLKDYFSKGKKMLKRFW